MRPSPRAAHLPLGSATRFRRRDERGLVVPARVMLVAIVLVALGAAMYVATTPSSSKQPAPAARQAASAASDPSPTASSSATRPSGSPTPTTSAPAKPSASPRATASTTSRPTAAAPSAAVRRAATFVEVFNNTKRKGLAGRAAKRAEGAGWKVVGSDNWYGTIPTSTVYYPRRFAGAAKVLARDMGITRVEPAVAPMRGDRLTVILTSGYRLR